ncbi:MAG TPA: SRPBCC domain-containing protein [Blastocatellia bacterium]|nr:SRPBCC domain-containing protein [Blastocatellia bacterium]
MKVIIHFVRVHATPQKVFQAVTTAEGLAGWWSTSVRFQPGVGGIVDFRFTADFNPKMEVTRLDPNQRVEWKCVAGHNNWQDNTFSFELRDSGGETDLMFKQVYAQELSDEVYGTYNFNWGYYLASLKRLCETGRGTPFKAS